MHFIGMLAYHLPIPVKHDPGLTMFSLGLAVLFTALGFSVARTGGGRPGNLALGGALMGSGIAAMHYSGLAAMLAPAEWRLDRMLVAASLLIAISAATAALWLTCRDTGPWRRVWAAAAMGLAISGMPGWGSGWRESPS